MPDNKQAAVTEVRLMKKLGNVDAVIVMGCYQVTRLSTLKYSSVFDTTLLDQQLSQISKVSDNLPLKTHDSNGDHGNASYDSASSDYRHN